MDIFSIIGNSASIVGTLFALFAWRESLQVKQVLEKERRRQEEQVSVALVCGSDKLILPSKIRRAELSRAEILGRVGMLPKNLDKLITVKQERFALDYLNTSEFLNNIDKIVSSREKQLTIRCTPEELNQFDRGKAQHFSNQ